MLKAKVDELTTALARYRDIEIQLVNARSSEEAIRVAKCDLQN